MILCLLVIWLVPVAFPQTRGSFLDPYNQRNVAARAGALGIFAIGETFVIITGGIDLSVGSLIAFTGVLLGKLMSSPAFNGREGFGLPLAPAIALALLAAALVGVFHGLLVSRLRMPPFVVTLGTMLALRSLALIVSDQVAIPIRSDTFSKIYDSAPLGVPLPLIMLIAVGVASAALLRLTSLGRYLYAVGGNEQAARLSGVNVRGTKMFAYVASAFLAGAAGVVYASYVQQGHPSSAIGYELSAIAAAVIGGASLMGGVGTVLGTVVGAAILTTILNVLQLMMPLVFHAQISPSLLEGAIVGGLVILAVALNILRQRGRHEP
jgi:ribose transport system permease protein